MMEPVVGSLGQVGEEIDFDFTDYYSKEMGSGLKRCFLVSDSLVGCNLLADLKHLTNRVERELARDDGCRRINLDPGLLSAGKFVLASTKNNAHRVYLRDGIFAEVTLYYRHRKFEPFEWTYPDYRTRHVGDLLDRIRTDYLGRLRDPGSEILREVDN